MVEQIVTTQSLAFAIQFYFRYRHHRVGRHEAERFFRHIRVAYNLNRVWGLEMLFNTGWIMISRGTVRLSGSGRVAAITGKFAGSTVRTSPCDNFR